MKLIGGNHLAIVLHGLEEKGIVIEGTRQLMGVSLVKIILECVVPRQGLIAIKRIAATDADSGEIGIRLDEFADFQEIGFCAFVPCLIIRLIEWRHTLYGESFLLGILHGGLDNAVPLLRLALVVGCIERLMVAVDFHRSGSRELDMGDAGIEGSFLGCRKLAVLSHQVARLERNSTRRNQILADVVGSSAHVTLVVPSGIHAPAHYKFSAYIVPIERNGGGTCAWLQIHRSVRWSETCGLGLGVLCIL